MNVVLLGSGNVATILGRLIIRSGHKVIHVASRENVHAADLANELGASFSTFSSFNDQNEMNADMYIVAVSDNAIEECVRKLNFRNKLIVHTAGAVSKDILLPATAHYGVLYPLQSLRKEMKDIPEIPFLIDGSNSQATDIIEKFARSLSGSVQKANDEERIKLHTGAVIVSNFTNHLYVLAEDFCKKEGVSFDLLKPLILETATRIQQNSPATVQTGPATRKDIHTLDKHLRVLSNYQRMRYLYLKLTDSIMNP